MKADQTPQHYKINFSKTFPIISRVGRVFRHSRAKLSGTLSSLSDSHSFFNINVRVCRVCANPIQNHKCSCWTIRKWREQNGKSYPSLALVPLWGFDRISIFPPNLTLVFHWLSDKSANLCS